MIFLEFYLVVSASIFVKPVASTEHHVTASKEVVIEKDLSYVNNLCPPWLKYNFTTESCECTNLYEDLLKCYVGATEEHTPTAYILDCYCVTYDAVKDLIEIGQCEYNCGNNRNGPDIDFIYKRLPPNISSWNHFTCGEFHRQGSLCGKCDEANNYYPRVHSFNVSCVYGNYSSLNVLKYTVAAYVPLTLFYFIIFLFKVDIHSSFLQGFIFFSQFITASQLVQRVLLVSRNKPTIQVLIKFIGAVYGVWNLDFFRTYDYHISLNISSMFSLSLDLLLAVYPMFLMVITYAVIQLYNQNYKAVLFMAKPFKLLNKNWSIKTSLINAFSAFLFLTNVKFIIICSYLLIPVKVTQLKGSENIQNEWRLFYDPTISYFGPEHRVYAFISVIIIFSVLAFPVAVFLLYSLACFQECLTILPDRWQLFLHIFMDSFQGCYKDGTEPNTRDCRWYASILYLSRPALLVVYAITADIAFFPLAAIIVTLIAMLTIIIDPFKAPLSHLSPAVSTFILSVSILYVSAAGTDITVNKNISFNSTFYVITFVVSLIPLFYASALTVQWITMSNNVCSKIHTRCSI